MAEQRHVVKDGVTTGWSRSSVPSASARAMTPSAKPTNVRRRSCGFRQAIT